MPTNRNESSGITRNHNGKGNGNTGHLHRGGGARRTQEINKPARQKAYPSLVRLHDERIDMDAGCKLDGHAKGSKPKNCQQRCCPTAPLSAPNKYGDGHCVIQRLCNQAECSARRESLTLQTQDSGMKQCPRSDCEALNEESRKSTI